MIAVTIHGDNIDTIQNRWRRILDRVKAYDFISIKVLVEPLWIKLEEGEEK